MRDKVKLFFGDSLTSGEGNNYMSFADLLGGVNLGVSGATLGDYSLYPVVNGSLIDMITKYQSDVKFADEIYIEYGCNDASAIVCGYTTIQHVLVDFVKALDYIRQLNASAKIYALVLSTDSILTVKPFATAQCKYLIENYFKEYDADIQVVAWLKVYMDLVEVFEASVECIPIIDKHEFDYAHYLCADGMHPNADGHKFIAETIKKYI